VSFSGRLRGSQFLRFAVVGAAGFLVNEAALFIGLKFLHLGVYAGFLFAFFVAVTFTWWGNRMLTFREQAAQGGRDVFAEWLKFVAANGLGFAVNYAVCVTLVPFARTPLNSPYVALGCGTLAGLVFNFAMSKRFVFRA
jgi:putative flippase GtrA